jgi:septal ring factor EnvC (AmiA/AmiB activator)
VYRYGRYRCSFHVTKGAAVCSNSMSIAQPVLDATLLAKFQAALSRDMIDDLVGATNGMLRQLHGTTPQEIDAVHHERREVERQLSNLVEFVANGDASSPRLREEIRAREQRLAELDHQLEGLRASAQPGPKQIDRAWVEAQVQRLSELLARDPVRARQEIQKHVEELRVAPAPEVGDRVVRITGRPKLDGLLGGEEAVRLQLVAGARNHLHARPLAFRFEVIA